LPFFKTILRKKNDEWFDKFHKKEGCSLHIHLTVRYRVLGAQKKTEFNVNSFAVLFFPSYLRIAVFIYITEKKEGEDGN